jgi:hypothetical protein
VLFACTPRDDADADTFEAQAFNAATNTNNVTTATRRR